MKIVYKKKNLQNIIKNEKNLGFVPTMGAIHKGHVSLIKKSNRMCHKTLVSIFVNKPQFNKNSDFKNYPRPIKRDILVLKKSGVDYLYIPTYKEIYPVGTKRNIKISSFAKKLCGKYRPNHFKGVVDVISRFIYLIKPRCIFLGKKDFQQLIIVKDFVDRNKFKVKVVGCKTVREKNGIAISSRNLLLSKKDITIASKIYKLIKAQKKNITKNKKNINLLKKSITKMGIKKVEYLTSININKHIKKNSKNKNFKIFIAYYLKKIRLIDNI